MKRGGGNNANGLFNIDFDTGVKEDMDENDSDLEAELLALAGNNEPKRPQRKKPTPPRNLDAMIAASMKDIPSDDEISVDENDPDLLSELNDIVGGDAEDSSPVDNEPTNSDLAPSDNLELLEKRLEMYEAAENHARETGETSKARRYGRGKSTIKDLIKQAKSGKPVNISDIPPEVKIPKAQPAVESKGEIEEPHIVEIEHNENPPVIDNSQNVEDNPQNMESDSSPSAVQSSVVDENLLTILKQRQMQYKMAALKAKKSKNMEGAVNYLKTAKQFEHVIEAVQNGQAVDISQMPGPPEMEIPQVEEEKVQQSSEVVEDTPKESTPAPPASLGEALTQCVEFYKKQEEKAKSEDNASKARRIGRIIKQFEQAIKQNKAGRPVATDELPVPPGFPPLQGPKPAPAPKPVTTENSGSSSETSSPQVAKPTPPKHTTTRNTGNQIPNSRADQQMQILLLRQKQFKEAALKAKKKGEISQAKEFLRTAKGFDKLIEATSCGLPVDFSTLPLPPDEKSHLDKEFDMVSAEDCLEDSSSGSDILTRLEHQLQKQLKMCLTTRDHNKALGDVAGTNRFERLALNVTKDLDVVRLAKKSPRVGIPKFHYENKDFSVVKSFTELTDNELEISVLRGINYNTENPKEIDTYVKFSFPWPQETPFTEKTATINDTNNPEYNANFSVPINRAQRSCQRTFKRHAVKFEVYSKGGWFRSDTLLGSVTVKLQNLETQCEVHDSYDLMDGRKKTGGKLEIRMRLRHPIVTQEVERLHEKWLVIDS